MTLPLDIPLLGVLKRLHWSNHRVLGVLPSNSGWLVIKNWPDSVIPRCFHDDHRLIERKLAASAVQLLRHTLTREKNMSTPMTIVGVVGRAGGCLLGIQTWQGHSSWLFVLVVKLDSSIIHKSEIFPDNLISTPSRLPLFICIERGTVEFDW